MKKMLAVPVMLLWAGAVLAQGSVSVRDAWIRVLPGDLPAAAYFVLDNGGDHALKLVGAESPAYAMAMIHRSMEQKGQANMMHVDAVDVPAGGRVSFAPGGYHVMFMHAKKTLKPGDTVPVTLIFAGGRRMTVEFHARSATGQSG